MKTSTMSKVTPQGLTARFEKAWARIRPQKLRAGVLVAVSGGVDSMVLANLVHRAGIRCAIAHVNFRLRGAESDADEAFVHDWAEVHGLAFYSTRYDTDTYAAARKTGIQETARALRYAWFEELLAIHDYSVVLTAHHADDSAETLLLNLFRGAGLRGLGGIPEVSGALRRPLLEFRKEELTAYASEQGISFREDASNITDDYLRNAVRHRLFPILEELFSSPASQLAAAAVRLREAGDVYQSAIQKRLKTLVDRRGPDTYVPIRALRKAEPLMTLAYEIFSPADFLPQQIPQILSLMEAETGRFVASSTHRVIRHREHLVIAPLTKGSAELLTVESLPAKLQASAHVLQFSEQPPPKTFAENSDVAWLDMDALSGPLVLRRARAGDYFYPLGMDRRKKKVARFLTALKVPRHEKESAWVLESGGRIGWLVGYRIDERFKVSERTQKALRVERTLLEEPR